MPVWRQARSLSRRLLPLTMGIVVAIFVGSTIYSQLLLSSDVDALGIAYNAAPSIATLADARGELRGLARSADQIILAANPAALTQSRAAYAERRRAVDVALAEYEKLPSYAGERALYDNVRGRLSLVDRELVAAPASDGDRHQTMARAQARIDELDASLRALSEFNRKHMTASAASIGPDERRRNLYAFLLDGLGILVAFFATVLAARTVERYIATLARRTKELEHLAIQVGHEVANPLVPIEIALRLVEQNADEHLRSATSRADRSIVRIKESIDRLISFAKAAMVPADPAPHTPLAPALEEAARAAGLTITVDPSWQVASAEPELREMLRGLLAGSVAPGAAPLLAVEVRASSKRIRIVVVVTPDGGGSDDPFAPQLRDPASGKPGMDLRLATVRRQVEACGGAVGMRQRVPQQCLWIELPRA
ncbi:MAG: two-component histidine kinase [bacterium]|nr:two-component histidine kinase [bacterium]